MENERDFLLYIHKGFLCAIVRTRLGHLCGYVALPKNHPLQGKGWEDLAHLDVHGCITFASDSLGSISKDVFSPLWWIGFDCAHLGDCSPKSTYDKTGIYRTWTYVENEISTLVDQLSTSERYW